MRSGIVIGKFLPPHAGHAFLIDTARAHVDHLYVLICEKKGQPIPGKVRARWLRELHPDCDVLVIPDIVADDDSPGWAAYTRSFLGQAPDVVFTSEDYGDAFAAHLGARHVCLDRARLRFPISATMVRGDPNRYRSSVAPCVWAYLVPRVAIVGAESSGKSTLCGRLAAHYQVPVVAEYGREYTVARSALLENRPWTSDEFVHIAREQQRREDAAARAAGDLLLCDTDAFATEIWLERHMTQATGLQLAAPLPAPPCGWPARDRPIDHYLVPTPDVPFVQDGLRDGEHLRWWMHQRFVRELERRGLPFTVLEGHYDERFTRAVAEIGSIIAAAPGGVGRNVSVAEIRSADAVVRE